MCGLIFLTINYAKNHSSSTVFSNNEIGTQPPSRNEGENIQINEPPEKL